MTETSQYFFFAITQPGLKPIALNELNHFITINELQNKIVIHPSDDDGIFLSAPLKEGLELNYILKIPTRILMRIAEFKCRDTPKLYQKISKIKWSEFLGKNDIIVHASSHKSRLFDSRKIEKAVHDGISLFFKGNPPLKKSIVLNEKYQSLHQIYIRFVDDNCTVSIDCSGDRLHKRGDKQYTAIAPIRENLAHALILKLVQNLTNHKTNLIDPMCGSGTFLLEANKLNAPNDKRDFAFHFFPHTSNIQTNVSKYKFNNFKFEKIIGRDIDVDVIQLAKKNIKNAEIIIEKEDIFSNNQTFQEGVNIVITNPPYGKRVKTSEIINDQYYTDLIEKIIKIYNPLKIGIIIPEDYRPIINNGYTTESITPFKNGGIKVKFYSLSK